MNIVADESVDLAVVQGLRNRGHSVTYIAEFGPGTADDEVLRMASSAGAVLLTADKDFGELIFRQHRLSSGVVLMRLSGLATDRKAELVGEFFDDRGSELIGAFSVLAPGKLRIRSDPPGA
jgi:predicted nuclease of predicted toxin-antitoxin system